MVVVVVSLILVSLCIHILFILMHFFFYTKKILYTILEAAFIVTAVIFVILCYMSLPFYI